MTDRPMNTPSGKVPGRGDYKGLYRADPPALTTGSGDVLPLISTSLADLLGGIDGTDHGRRRVYDRSDECHLHLQSVCVDEETACNAAQDDAADAADAAETNAYDTATDTPATADTAADTAADAAAGFDEGEGWEW